LTKQQHVFFMKQRVSLVEEGLARYSLEEIEKRTGVPLPLQPGDSVFDFSDRTLEFLGCSFENVLGAVNQIGNLSVKSMNIMNCTGVLKLLNLRVENLLFPRFTSDNHYLRVLQLDRIKLHGVLKIYAHGSRIDIENSSFTIALPPSGIINLAQNNYLELDDNDGLSLGLNYDNINFYNSSFEKDASENKLTPFDLKLEAKNIKMVNNSFGYIMQLRGFASESLNIKWNKFPKFIDFFQLRFPEFECYIPFAQFEQSNFVRLDIRDLGVYEVAGDSAGEYNDENLVDNLTSFYKRLYDNYRSRADLTSSNHIYVRLKELEIAHLKMKPDKDLEDRMRLRLNQLMGFYTDHATSPGKAIIISFYIVLLFGVFYFFFPSEWDKTGKKQLVEDFKIFINKNEHGYVKPFFKMTKGFLLSFLNAVTLSMNAFITLGFGSIPTTGLARYVCVFQGVLGWFLLSLFTVALLNQVLL
ncbi:MAG TPA: ion channel, partial [Cyclobacteriaceae bacterium]|nr:ion channel [Cyclobacteriaceae bacterium]